jgi:outer membrane protein OmpA-like peptidoglycan-associated protein
MKKILSMITMLMVGGMAAVAAAVTTPAGACGVSVSSSAVEQNGRLLTVDMQLDMSRINLNRNQAVLLQPRLVNGTDTLLLQPVGVYGTQRYYYMQRNGGATVSGTANELSYRLKDCPQQLKYQTHVDFSEWMEGAELQLTASTHACRNCGEGAPETTTLLADVCRRERPYEPELLFVAPKAVAEKQMELSRTARVIFKVDRTEIVPEYYNNLAELNKISRTIDSVRTDPDITITALSLKGYASPEGRYQRNVELAYGRTEAIRNYIATMYHVNSTLLSASAEPEDWQGVVDYLNHTSLPHSAEILRMIADNGGRDLDALDARIRTLYPQDYAALLSACYPLLRRTDYKIAYTIRCYTDVEEIKRILAEKPQKLSLNEMYLAAQTMEVGSPEFQRVFEIAALLHPTDPIANLNMANIDLEKGNLDAAAGHLQKAGTSAEADYTRGVLALRRGDVDLARTLFGSAAAQGISQAKEALSRLKAER